MYLLHVQWTKNKTYTLVIILIIIVLIIYQCTYSWYVKNDNRKNRHANTSALPTIPVTWNNFKIDETFVYILENLILDTNI